MKKNELEKIIEILKKENEIMETTINLMAIDLYIKSEKHTHFYEIIKEYKEKAIKFFNKKK